MKDYIIPGIFAILLLFVLSFYSIKIDRDIKKLEERIEVIEQVEIMKDSTINLHDLTLNKENFEYVCAVYDIQHPEIVYAQAKLESGHFTSDVYRKKNNFLGLYDSKQKDYFSFDHWTDCLLGYKKFVQRKWDGNGNYYTFLERLPYASDSNYITKVKSLVYAQKSNI